MDIDSHYLFPALVLARALLGFTPWFDALQHDHQLSSPLTAYPRLREGVYLFEHGIDPYSGGLFRHSPLLLSTFSTVFPLNRVTSGLLWSASDAVAAWALTRIWRARQRLKSATTRDGLISVVYLCNPYNLLSTLALSTSTFENTLFLLSVMFASEGNASLSLLSLSLATHLSLTSCLYLLPVVLVLLSAPTSQLVSPRPFPYGTREVLKKGAPLVGEYLLYTLTLAGAATLACGNLGWVSQTWGASFTLPDLTPNPGLWWYFFTEMFDHFRPFFLMVFSVHLVIYPLPLSIKFQHDPLYAVFLLSGAIATFRPYPSLADAGLFISFAALFPETYAYLRHPFPTALLHLHSSLLLPLFHHLWLGSGTGNANFFYASTLVWGIGMGMGVGDAIWAGLLVGVKGSVKKEVADKEGVDWEITQE